MPPLIVQRVLLWGYACFYGAINIVVLFKDIFTLGFKKVLEKSVRKPPACLQNPDLGSHGFLHLEDVRIHYVANGPEDKPLMLFLHGFPDFWYSWRLQLPEFSKDYRCVAIDMRGYGESDKPKGKENYQMKYLMKDVQQVIEALGYKSCVLVAHDWGGAVAWSFARLYPQCVDKMVVMNCPAAPVFLKLLYKDKQQFRMSWYMFFFQLPYLPEFILGLKDFSFFDVLFTKKGKDLSASKSDVAEEKDAYKYTFSQPGALTPPINYYRAALRMPRDNYDMNYDMPILLIWGMEDMALCQKIPDLTEQMAPSISVKRLEGASHFVQFDAPEAVNKLMREWL